MVESQGGSVPPPRRYPVVPRGRAVVFRYFRYAKGVPASVYDFAATSWWLAYTIYE